MNHLLNSALSHPLSYVRIGEFNSICLGFGDIVDFHPKTGVEYAEFDLICYERSWRLVKDGEIASCGVGSLEEGDLNVAKPLIGRRVAKCEELPGSRGLVLEIQSGCGVTRIEFWLEGQDLGDDLLTVADNTKGEFSGYVPILGWRLMKDP